MIRYKQLFHLRGWWKISDCYRWALIDLNKGLGSLIRGHSSVRGRFPNQHFVSSTEKFKQGLKWFWPSNEALSSEVEWSKKLLRILWKTAQVCFFSLFGRTWWLKSLRLPQRQACQNKAPNKSRFEKITVKKAKWPTSTKILYENQDLAKCGYLVRVQILVIKKL